MSALTEAIARSFTTREKQPPARSPLRALGRRQLSGAEVLAQSVATTAPAVSMVVLPVTMLTHGRLLSGMITIIAATVLVTLIAFCVSQFTRRMAASGGLHSFVFRGLGTRAALTTGIAMLVKYVGSAVMTLYHGGQAAIALLGFAGVHVDKTFHVIALYLGIALLILGALVRSVRFAALAILVVESCSLLFIVGLMILGGSGSQQAQIVPPTSGHGLLLTALAAVFALAGFESAAFFGPEARRPLVTVTRTLAELLRGTAASVLADRGLDVSVLPETLTVERPRNPEHGDYATNIAMQVAKKVGTNPRELAGWIAEALTAADGIESAEIAGPGFLNIRLDKDAQGAIVVSVLEAGASYGSGDSLAGKKINLEFVSANPTGPIHLGGTRWAAVGDALGRILSAQGGLVTREYYFNDHGAQIDRFSRSLIAAAKGEPAPEDGYAGAYIADIAASVLKQRPDVMDLPADEQQETFRAIGVELMFTHIKQTLHDFGVDFDVYFHENSLFESGAVEKAVESLKGSGNLFHEDGAWWLKSTDYGDDKDRVVIKSDGNAAYIAGDIAYFQNKRARGFDLCIYMLGADHHGYIGRLKAAAAAFGDDPDTVEVLIGQMVNLVKDGTAVKMSKRAGTVITLDDLVEAIGVDASRYVMIRSSVDSSIDIDLDLWTKTSSENPVYYVQYAHARLSAIARNAADLGLSADASNLALLTVEQEGDLIRTIGEYPRVVSSAANLREPHRIARYLEELAGAYHRFYGACRILPQGDEDATDVHRARLALCAATRQVLANGLELLGVTAPEQM